ncbi:hypothetical protein DITRI_Ditri06bG0051200 [Diplodiscus trichospermus]
MDHHKCFSPWYGPGHLEGLLGHICVAHSQEESWFQGLTVYWSLSQLSQSGHAQMDKKFLMGNLPFSGESASNLSSPSHQVQPRTHLCHLALTSLSISQVVSAISVCLKFLLLDFDFHPCVSLSKLVVRV